MLRTRFQPIPQPPAAPWAARDTRWLIAVTVLALLIRLPYWRTIPAAGDETAQATLAMRIARGEALPLSGTDAYTGPAFVYAMAALYRLGVTDPFLGRALMLGAGTLTVSVTYLLIRRLTGRARPSLLASALVAFNPHQVLLSSHPGAATFLMPFFLTVFTWAALAARDTGRPWIWLAACVSAGLAVHANPLASVPIGGLGLWFLLDTRGAGPTGVGWRWPLWPALGGLAIGLVCAPMLAQAGQLDNNTADALQARSYLWEADPTLVTYGHNLYRLGLQLLRQTAGVLDGLERPADLAGPPVLLALWMAAGWAGLDRRAWPLLLAAIGPYCLIVPYFSAHYGILEPVRFTTYMTPLFAGGMALAVERGLRALPPRAGRLGLALFGAAALLGATPLISLARYYAYVERNQLSGQVLHDLAAEMAREGAGAKVYMAYSDEFLLALPGIPYVPQAFAASAAMAFEFIPTEQIIGRLFLTPQPALMWLMEADAAQIRQVAALTEWPGAAEQQARRRGFGLYRLDPATALIKPDFVLTEAEALAIQPQTVTRLAVGGLLLIGYDAPARAQPGASLPLRFYWQAPAALPADTYIRFVHVFAPDGQTLAAQSDLQLGQFRYPVNAWLPAEVIVDDLAIALPATLAPGRYQLRMGVYRWPSLQRLPIPGHTDNLLALPSVEIAP